MNRRVFLKRAAGAVAGIAIGKSLMDSGTNDQTVAMKQGPRSVPSSIVLHEDLTGGYYVPSDVGDRIRREYAESLARHIDREALK